MNLPLDIAKKIARSSTIGNSRSLIKIAIATIALSIATMLLSSTIIEGFKNQISKKIFGFWGHIHITDTRITRNHELRPIVAEKQLIEEIRKIKGLDYRNIYDEPVKTEGGVSNISPYITMPGILNRKKALEGILLKGVDSTYIATQFSSYILEGDLPDLRNAKNSRGILISNQTALRLELKLNDKVNIHFVNADRVKKPFHVCGIYKTGLEEYDRKFAIIDMRMIQEVLGWEADQIGGLEIFVDNVEESEAIANHIYNELLPSHMYAETIQEKQKSIFEWLKLQNINEIVILLLMVVVALINMATVVLILILERSKMVGILKSLGQQDWDIRKIFIYSALYIIMIALIVGNIIGLGIAFLQQKFGFLKLNEDNYYLSQVPIDFDLGSFLLINIGTILVTLVVMILPTYLITRLDPVKILRFD